MNLSSVTFHSITLASGREMVFYSSTFVLAIVLNFGVSKIYVTSLCCDLGVVSHNLHHA